MRGTIYNNYMLRPVSKGTAKAMGWLEHDRELNQVVIKKLPQPQKKYSKSIENKKNKNNNLVCCLLCETKKLTSSYSVTGLKASNLERHIIKVHQSKSCDPIISSYYKILEKNRKAIFNKEEQIRNTIRNKHLKIQLKKDQKLLVTVVSSDKGIEDLKKFRGKKIGYVTTKDNKKIKITKIKSKKLY